MRKDEKFELAYELYKKRLSLSQVAKEFNVTRQYSIPYLWGR